LSLLKNAVEVNVDSMQLKTRTLREDDVVLIYGTPSLFETKEGSEVFEHIAKDDKFQITKSNISVLQRSV